MNKKNEQKLVWSEMWQGVASFELSEALKKQADCRTLSDGERLYSTGDTAKEFYGVKSGAVQLMLPNFEGNETLTCLHTEGSWFGELSLIDEAPHPVSAYAIGSTELYSVNAKNLRRMLEKHPEWHWDFAKVLCYKLRLSIEFFNSGFLRPAVRIALRLLDLSVVYGKQQPDGILIDIKLVQEDLAKMLVLRRKTVNINIKALEKENLLMRRNGRIVIPDEHSLRYYIARSIEA